MYFFIIYYYEDRVIEWNLGRSVRSEKDYSVIMLIGEDLVRFVKTSRNQQLFSSQTRTQIKLGENVTEMVKDDFDPTKPMMSFLQVIKQLHRQLQSTKISI